MLEQNSSPRVLLVGDGYRGKITFIGPNPELYSVMEGRSGESAIGRLRRFIIDPNRRRVRLETLSDEDHEFPIVNPDRACHKHRYGYFARSQGDSAWWTQLVRIDTRSGAAQHFDLGEHQYCAEPIFAPDPNAAPAGPLEEDRGWLLSEVYDGIEETSYLAILCADRLEDGPVAKVNLEHHVPLSFHGTWVAS